MNNAATLSCEPHAAGIDAVRQTLTDLHDQRMAWEQDVTALFDDFDSLAVQMALKSTTDNHLAVQAATATEDRWRELVGKSTQMERQQEETTHQLAAMQALIEQQTELLTAFIGAATELSLPAAPPCAGRCDPMANSGRADFDHRGHGSENRPAAFSIETL